MWLHSRSLGRKQQNRERCTLHSDYGESSSETFGLRSAGAGRVDECNRLISSIDGSIISDGEVAHDAIYETRHGQCHSPLDRASPTIPELARTHHIRFRWIVGSVRVARRAARQQMVAHNTRRYSLRGRVRPLPRLPFVLNNECNRLFTSVMPCDNPPNE